MIYFHYPPLGGKISFKASHMHVTAHSAVFKMAEGVQQPLPKRHDLQTSADLERVTDYAEEKEISTTDIENAISLVEGRYSEEKAAKLQREKELARVVIKKEDVDLIVDEMEIPRAAAERSLREHKGDVVEALVSLTI